jgi:hypothetical protein
MLYSAPNTLSWFNESPYMRPLEVGGVACSTAAAMCETLRKENQVNPDAAAIEFYCLNHLYAVVNSRFGQHEVLPPWARTVCKAYHTCLETQGARMLGYLALIITRESRHGTIPSHKLAATYGAVCTSFTASVKGQGSAGAANLFQESPPDVSLGLYARYVSDVFFTGKFSGGYGGKPWGVIAQTMASMLEGKTSMEMMLDTAYTLAHNNGPMFNKGMLYTGYSEALYRILDIQRSGQIPELVRNPVQAKIPKTLIYPAISKLVTTVCAELPDVFGEVVNWQQVKDLGALKNYASEILAQKKANTFTTGIDIGVGAGIDYSSPTFGPITQSSPYIGHNVVGVYPISKTIKVTLVSRPKTSAVA